MKKIIDIPVKNCKGLIADDFKYERKLDGDTCQNLKFGNMVIISLVYEDTEHQYFHCFCPVCGFEEILTTSEMEGHECKFII